MKHRISMLWPDGLKKALTFSYDDGVMQDMRLISLFRHYGLKATFNLNSAFFGRIDTLVRDDREIDHSHVPAEDIRAVYSGFEAAVHTATHPNLTQLSNPNVVDEIITDRAAIEQLVRYPVRGMAYPFGTVDSRIKELVHACGIVYSRGVGVTGDYSLPDDSYDWSCSCHHSGLEPLIDPFVNDERRLLLLSVWGHSYEFDQKGDWEKFENQLSRLGRKDDIWYATNIEIFDYLDAYRALRWTTDGSVAVNPSYQDVFIEADGETICITGGGKVEL